MIAVVVSEWLLAGLGLVLAGLVCLLLVEIYAGSRWTPPARANFKAPKKLAVIVPAHNEAAQIAGVLRAIQAEIRADDRVLVVADNCVDNTYEIARSTGAEVIRRDDQTNRGKGFALDFAVKHLAADPPDIVIVMDADCYATPGSLLQLASWASANDRPVQAQYDMLLPSGDCSPSLLTAAFSYRVKALIRPLGLQRLGWPCGLMGTGMAFPWATISHARLATSQIVEDLVLTLELANEGKAPLYCYDAKITSTFPDTTDAQKSQRERWETGHVNVILQVLPRMLVNALITGNRGLLALTADTAIPPLALLALLVALQVAAAMVLLALSGVWVAFALGVANCIALVSAIVIAWRAAVPGAAMGTMLRRVPGYVFGKLGIYLRVLLRRRVEWVRTQRK